MAYIATVRPGKVTGETADVYRYMAEVGGDAYVARVVQLFSLRPASMRRMIRSWDLAMWAGGEPRSTREMLASAVSRFNNCHY